MRKRHRNASRALGFFIAMICVVATVASCALLNQKPVAVVRCAASYGHCPMEVALYAHDSFDSDGILMEYKWDFGDGATGTGAMVTHTFDEAGTYKVILQVTDDDGSIGKAEMTFVVKGSLTGKWLGTMTRGRGGEPLAYTLVFDLTQEKDELTGEVSWGTIDPRIDPQTAYVIEIPITEGRYNVGSIRLLAEGLWHPDGSAVPPHVSFYRYEMEFIGTCGEDLMYGTYTDTVGNESGNWFVARQ